VGLRPLVCSAKICYYTTVSKDKYTPLRSKRQTQGPLKIDGVDWDVRIFRPYEPPQ